jgi:hypothetical protein
MSWWQRLWRTPASAPLPERLRVVNLTMEGWIEEAPTAQMRTWRNAEGDVLSLAAADGFGLPTLDDMGGLQRWCRAVAESSRAGLIEMRLDTGRRGASVAFIYKRLEMPAYVFTGVLVVPGDEVAVWTVVSGERGTTGVREAVVTTQLVESGALTIEQYQRSWAEDPYDATYRGVDRSALRFMSDDERYDEQFPEHPLSKVRRVLAALPGAVQIESGTRRQ